MFAAWPSLAFLEPYDWTDLPANIAQDSTTLIPWSLSFQTALQGVLQNCATG